VAEVIEACKGPGRIKRLNQFDSWVSMHLVGGIAKLGKGALDLNSTLSSRGCERDYNNFFNGNP